MALSVETYEQLQNRIKNLEAKLFLMIDIKNYSIRQIIDGMLMIIMIYMEL